MAWSWPAIWATVLREPCRISRWICTIRSFNVQVEVREETYVYHETIQGPGRPPVGCSGKTGLLLSGGIDSPVAGYMMAKRGLAPVGIYFHAFPYTSDRAKEKVVSLAKILAGYTGELQAVRRSVYGAAAGDYRKMSGTPDHDPDPPVVWRGSRKRSRRRRVSVSTTGAWQVASQTQESLLVTNEAARLPVLRPLIGMDKQEIVEIAQRIGTFETSILPYEDCCTIFVPKHPDTKPKLAAVKKSEEALAGNRAGDDPESGGRLGNYPA